MYTDPIVVKREQKTAAFNAMLSAPSDTDKNGPMQWAGYSRFIVTIIDKTGETLTCPHANIPQSDIHGIYAKKNAIVNARTIHEMISLSNGSSASSSSDSANLDPTIIFGKHKGKKVSEAAATMTQEEIKKQIAFYEDKIPKFPSNIDFVKAYSLYLDGNEETAETSSASMPMVPSLRFGATTLYEQKMKFLRSNTDDKGNVLVYSIAITYNPAMRYPYDLRIENGYAPIAETATGGFNVEASKIINKVSANFKFGDTEFEEVVDKLYSNCRDFESMMFATQYRKAKRITAEDAKYTDEQIARSERQYVPETVLAQEDKLNNILQMLEEIQQVVLPS